MTLNDHTIYTSTDPLRGGRNATTLVADSLLPAGLFFLSGGVMRTVERRPRLVRAAVSILILAVSQLSISITFLLIDHRKTTARFMNDLGDQPAAAVNSRISFSYCLVVTAAMLTLADGHSRHNSGILRFFPPNTARTRIGLRRHAFPCRDRHGHRPRHRSPGLMHTIQPTYEPLVLLIFLLLCSGFANPPAVRRTHQYLHERRATGSPPGSNRSGTGPPTCDPDSARRTSMPPAQQTPKDAPTARSSRSATPSSTLASRSMSTTPNSPCSNTPNPTSLDTIEPQPPLPLTMRTVRRDPSPRFEDRSCRRNFRRRRMNHRATTHRTRRVTKARLRCPRHQAQQSRQPDRPAPHRPDHSRRNPEPLVRARRLSTALGKH